MVDSKTILSAYRNKKQRPLAFFFTKCYICGEELKTVHDCFKVHNKFICGLCLTKYKRTRQHYKYLPPLRL